MEHVEDYVHGLSQIEFYGRSNRSLPSWFYAPQSYRERIAQLDALAKLLVFAPKGDVAATSYWQSSEELKILWAKNQSVYDSNQLKYIEDLIENLQNGIEIDEVLDMVISTCRGRILYLIKKLAESFGVGQDNRRQESNLWRFDETNKSHQNFEAELRKFKWFQNQDKPTVQVLDIITRFIANVTITSEIKSLFTAIFFSYCVTSIDDLEWVLEEKQVRCLWKLGDYVRNVTLLSVLVHKKAGKTKITIEQVRPPTAKPIEVLSGSLDLLNLRCGQIPSDNIAQINKWDLVTDVYRKAQPGQPTAGKKTVHFTQHCEITLALEMITRYTQRGITKRRIEIGLSKACCKWCWHYLHLLTSEYPNYPVLVRDSHGKQPDGWMLPPNGSKSVAKNMAKSIEKKVDKIIREIDRRRELISNDFPDWVKVNTFDWSAMLLQFMEKA